jgi:hypothetical protein
VYVRTPSAFINKVFLLIKKKTEFSASTLKLKESREVKNLECSINYDVMSFGSSRGKAREPLL